MDANEREQYEAAIHGDREAFEMIIRTHSRTLFAIAYGILQSREEAEDVVQDSLVKAWKTRWRVRDPEKFPAWLTTIARHKAHDIFRKRRTVPLSKEGIEPTEIQFPDTTAIDQQLHSALAALPELHRTALTLRYFEEMDYRTIENTLGLTNGALRGILGRALASLRKQLRPAPGICLGSLAQWKNGCSGWGRVVRRSTAAVSVHPSDHAGGAVFSIYVIESR